MVNTNRRYPDSPVFYRTLDRELPLITRGEGVWLFDESGRAWLDACGGAYVANLGHGMGTVAEAVADQIRRVAYVNGTAFSNQPVEDLAAALRDLSPDGLAYSWFLSSGSEATEAALKLARQYHVERGSTSKHRIIARSPGYHGNTLLALSASARKHYQKMFGPWLVPVSMIGTPYPYRMAPDDPAMTGEALEAAILAEGPENVAAFIAEPVSGSSTGGSVPPAGYWPRIREICDRYDVLLIADEVLSGAGRTGRWLAMEHFGVTADIVTMGKGLSGGYVPLSAVITSRRIIDPIAQGSGAFKHAQTFSHTPAMCAAGLAAVRHIVANDLIGRAARLGEVLEARLATLRALPMVGDVRGLGLLAGVELVADKDTKAPFERSHRVAETLVAEAHDRGLVLWPNIGHADGERGDLVMVAPPFIITEAEIDLLVERLGAAIEATAARIRGGS